MMGDYFNSLMVLIKALSGYQIFHVYKNLKVTRKYPEAKREKNNKHGGGVRLLPGSLSYLDPVRVSGEPEESPRGSVQREPVEGHHPVRTARHDALPHADPVLLGPDRTQNRTN